MTKINCKISNLEEVCKIVSLKGVNTQGKEYVAIPDFLINASADGLKVFAMDSGGHFALSELQDFRSRTRPYSDRRCRKVSGISRSV